MSFIAKNSARIAIVASLAAALAIPATAGAIPNPAKKSLWAARTEGVSAAVISDDDIPGMPLAASPVTGDFTYNDLDSDDWVDVYSVDLIAGQSFGAVITPSVLTRDYDLELYAPGTSAPILAVGSMPLGAAWGSKGVDALFDSYSDYQDQFVAPATGTYYLVVWDWTEMPYGTGTYTIDWAKGVAPTASVKASLATVGYGLPSYVTGSVVGTDSVGLVGQKVELWGSADPSVDFVGDFFGSLPHIYTRVATSVTTTGGAYSFAAKPVNRTTYVVRTASAPEGYAFAQSGRVTVKPKVYLTTPSAPSTVYHNKAFTAFGYLKPKHTKGAKTVKIAAYRYESGKWVLRKTVYATNYDYTLNGSTYTKYSASVTVPYAGKWKLVSSTADDGAHAYTLSGARYVTAK